MLMWKREIELNILKYSHDFTHRSNVEDPNNEIRWQFMKVFGHPKMEKYKETWTLKKFLYRDIEKANLTMGDFSKILS